MPIPSDITIYGGDYEHTHGIPGEYDSGMVLRYEVMRVQDIFAGMLEARRFEACEFSLANYLTLRGTGEHWLSAVPVFPYRAFRHALAVTQRDSTLDRLDRLAGTRIGVEDYSMTAAVWFRGLLEDEYGVDPRSITWITRAKQRFALPSNAKIETTDADLEDMVCSGAIDAMLGFTLRDNLLPVAQRRLRPVLVDAVPEERAYYARTGIYPIMHCVVIRNDVLEKNPAVATAVCAAYEAAKASAHRRPPAAPSAQSGPLHWTRDAARFGGDPLPYGLTAQNRMVIERLAHYLKRQGFISEAPRLEMLFARA